MNDGQIAGCGAAPPYCHHCMWCSSDLFIIFVTY